MKKYVSAVIFWGALWGLEEATLGHLLHAAALNSGWFFWFPLAYFFMSVVYKQTGKLHSILFTSIIAAAIKLVNLFMTANLVIVICPVLSILLEGISLFIILKLVDLKKYIYTHKFAEVAIISILWRTLYTISILAIPARIMPVYPYKTITLLLKFILFEGITNSLIIYIFIILKYKMNAINEKNNIYLWPFADKIIKSKLIKDLCFKPLVSLILLIAAILVQ